MRLPTKIPTLLALILIIILIGGVIVLERIFRTPSTASGSQKPEHVHFTNISDTSFSVTWTTQLPTTGTVLVSAPDKSNQIYYDERDANGKLSPFVTHSVTIRDAKPLTDYSITLLSNGQKHLDNGNPYAIHTAATLPPNTSGLEPAYGTARSAVDQPLEGSIVYLTVEGSQELSTITKPSGLWLIPLNQIRTADLTSYLPTVDRMTENIIVEAQNEQATAVTDTLNDSPVPEMIEGKSYDFRRQQAKTSETKTLALRQTTAPLPTGSVLGVNNNRTFTITLTSPSEGAALPTNLPLITGTGIPNTYVGISVGITQIMSGSAKVDANGLWNFTPPRPLPAGRESVTITALDQSGKPVAITHTFQILKSGTQVLGDATPSATLVPTESPIPTLEASPSGSSSLSGEPPPDTGNELPTILLILLGFGFLVSGGVVALK